MLRDLWAGDYVDRFTAAWLVVASAFVAGSMLALVGVFVWALAS